MQITMNDIAVDTTFNNASDVSIFSNKHLLIADISIFSRYPLCGCLMKRIRVLSPADC
jgi:hypothetical protein